MISTIICSGVTPSEPIIKQYMEESDVIICADGGANILDKYNIIPDIILGDFDSIDDEKLEKYKQNKKVSIIQYPTDKDMTDSEIALDKAIKMGSKKINILGAVGSRMGHSIANVMLLEKYCENNVQIVLIDDDNRAEIITAKTTFIKDTYKYVSLIPISKIVEGIQTEGLKYKLENDTLGRGTTRGVSNEFVEEQAIIDIYSGIVLVVLEK